MDAAKQFYAFLSKPFAGDCHGKEWHRIGLPMANEGADFVRVGQLFLYGANINQIYRRAASYVDIILKGANHDLPVEQPTASDS